MKRIASTIICALLVSLAANAQLLWRVEGKGLKKPSYLFGTHHVAPADMTDRVPGLLDAIESTEGVYGEVDMTDLNPMEVQQMMMPHMMAPADSTLSKVFTKPQLDSISALMTAYTGQQIDVAMMDMLKPVMISTQLAILQSLKAFPGFDPNSQLDQKVQGIAKAAGKKVGGLETLEYQMGILYDTPIAEQAKDLLESVRDDSTAVVQAAKLANAYTEADLPVIEDLLYNSPDMTQEKLEKVLLVRNRDWAVKLPAIFSEQPVVVAVGCGHLPGKEGVIELLRAQGYTVTPVDKK